MKDTTTNFFLKKMKSDEMPFFCTELPNGWMNCLVFNLEKVMSDCPDHRVVAG
jgi:hypothetical protein